jgi:protein SCO1/2
MKRTTPFVLILSVIALVLGLGLNYLLSPTAKKPPQIDGFLWPQSKTLADINLIDNQERAFTLDDFKGKWSLIFFGYTHCPDVCPTTLTVLKGVKQKLGAHAQETANTQYVFISVDRERDVPEILSNYVNYFDPEFIGVTGEQVEIEKLTRQLGVVYMRIPDPNNANSYLVDHSASVMLIDPLGRMIALFSAPHAADTIADRYLAMRQFLNQQAEYLQK